MLDTNIVSAAIRLPGGPFLRRVVASTGDLAISGTVAAELRFGMEKRRAETQLARLEDLLRSFPVLPLATGIEVHYARLRVALETRGKLIWANDMLIAAHALALGATLFTDDRDFDRVEGLVVENWLRD